MVGGKALGQRWCCWYSPFVLGLNGEIDTPAPRLRDAEALEAEWRGVVDVVDSLLERADVCLDEFSGAVRRLKPGGQQVCALMFREEHEFQVEFGKKACIRMGSFRTSFANVSSGIV